MATMTEIEMAMYNKLKEYYHSVILGKLGEANQEIPNFVGDDAHKQGFLDKLAGMEADNEYNAAVVAEARDKLFDAIQALDAQTKINLGIDHLFP